MSNKELLEAKREIMGHEVFFAVQAGFELAKGHPDVSVRETVAQVIMSILFDPEFIEKSKELAKHLSETSMKRYQEMKEGVEE